MLHIKERWHEGYQNCLTDTSRLYRADTRKKIIFNRFSARGEAFQTAGVNIYKWFVVVIPNCDDDGRRHNESFKMKHCIHYLQNG